MSSALSTVRSHIDADEVSSSTSRHHENRTLRDPDGMERSGQTVAGHCGRAVSGGRSASRCTGKLPTADTRQMNAVRRAMTDVARRPRVGQYTSSTVAKNLP